MPFSPPGPAPSWRRLEGVDVLRGLAIFFVLMNHVNIRLMQAHVDYTQGSRTNWSPRWFGTVSSAFRFFFAVSGFLITSTTLRRWSSLSRVNLRDFYLLRFARIAPFFVLVIAVLSFLHLAGVKHFVVLRRQAAWAERSWPHSPSTSTSSRLAEDIFRAVGTSCGLSL